jgi:phospholipase C
MNRRDFVRSCVALAATASPLAGAARAGAATQLPAPDRSGIEHVIVLMMENRSFDHLLGWLPGADGRQEGLSYVDRAGKRHATYPLAPDFQGCGHPDPDHSASGGLVQYNGGACDGFLRAGSDRYAVGYYRRRDLGFLGRAAPDWTVCDRYFSAVMGDTAPNRVYQHAGVAPGLYVGEERLRLPTIWDRLAARRLSGRSYTGSGEPFLKHWGDRYDRLLGSYSDFLRDCSSGRLPHVAFVDPFRQGSERGLSRDDHPFADVRAGEAFLARTYNAVVSSPQWRSTVFVITYDEWGGFFDHVPPPRAPDVDPALTLRGFRVPCLVVSPFARRRHVTHRVFDHASILRMIEWRWSLEPLAVRDAKAHNLAGVLDFRRRNLHAPRYAVPSVKPASC